MKVLKVKKATGLDGISARFLKDSATVIAPTVTFLVKLSLSTGNVPYDWKMKLVLFLCTSQVVGRTWTTIDIPPLLSKVLEKAVNFRLLQYLKKFDLLSPFQ